MTFSITTISLRIEYPYTYCHFFLIFMLNAVIMPSVIMMSVVVLSVLMLNVTVMSVAAPYIF